VSDYTPTPEAVEAAARAWHEAPAQQGDDLPGLWADVPDDIKARARAYMTAALTAAGPLIEQAVRDRVAAEIEAFEPEDRALVHVPDWREAMEDAARIARGEGSNKQPGEPEYPKPCSNCGKPYGACTERLRSDNKACCGECGYAVTHGQNAWEAWDRKRRWASPGGSRDGHP
jgi:hypothetical protein